MEREKERPQHRKRQNTPTHRSKICFSMAARAARPPPYTSASILRRVASALAAPCVCVVGRGVSNGHRQRATKKKKEKKNSPSSGSRPPGGGAPRPPSGRAGPGAGRRAAPTAWPARAVGRPVFVCFWVSRHLVFRVVRERGDGRGGRASRPYTAPGARPAMRARRRE